MTKAQQIMWYECHMIYIKYDVMCAPRSLSSVVSSEVSVLPPKHLQYLHRCLEALHVRPSCLRHVCWAEICLAARVLHVAVPRLTTHHSQEALNIDGALNDAVRCRRQHPLALGGLEPIIAKL